MLAAPVFASPEQTLSLTDAERQWLARHPVIRVAPDPYFPPVEWFDTAGTFNGIAADYLRLVERKLGVRFELVRCTSWDEVLAKARNREVDLLSAAAQTPERGSYLNFTEPHLVFPGVIITRKGTDHHLRLADLTGMKIAVVSGYVWQEMIDRDNPEITIDAVPDIQTGLRKVSFGIDDAMIENIATATWCIEREGITNLMIGGETPYLSRLSFATRDDWPELRSLIDKALSSIDQERREEIYRRWIHLDSIAAVRQPIFWISLLSVLAAALLLLWFALLWNRALQRQVRQRTSELEAALHSIPDGIYVVDRNLRLVMCNEALRRMVASTGLGSPKIGSHVNETIPAAQTPYLEDEVREVLTSGRSVHNERELTLNGQLLVFSMKRVPIHNPEGKVQQVLTVVQDLTRERAVQRRLQESEHKFSEMVENANSIILCMDHAGVVTFFNRFAESFFGFAAAEIVGRNVVGTIVPAVGTAGEDLARMMREIGENPQRYASNENENIRKDGTHVWVSWTNKPIYDLRGAFSEVLCVGNDITQLKQVQQALRRERDFSEAVFQTAGALVCVLDREGRVVRFNGTCERITGYTFGEVENKPVWEILIPDEEQATVRERLSNLLAGDFPNRGENHWMSRAGERRLISWYNTALTNQNNAVDFVVSTGIDITEARLAEKRVDEALAEAQKRYRFLFEESPAGALIMRSDGVIADISRSLAESLGYPRDEVIGRQTSSFVVAEEREEQIRRLSRRFQDVQTEQVEVRVNARDGSVRTILFSAGQAVLHEDGKPDTVLVTGIDITDRKAAEELARLREQELVHADKMASLGILVSGVAHEINNPNNFIILNADNLTDIWKDAARVLDKSAAAGHSFSLAGIGYPEVREEVPRLITGIGEGAKRIRNIVLNLKDFARPQTPTMDEWVNLNRVLEAAMTILANLIRKSTDRFETLLDPDLPPVKGNFQKIEQVVINLLTNACQALTNREAAVRVATITQAERVLLEIADEGVGIAAEQLTHVFDPFFTTKRDSGGTGLGLSISYSIVKEHGGELTITSQPGAGTTVRVSLPRALLTQGVCP